MPDQFEGIDFEELNEATGLATDEIKCLKVCFDLFDTKKVEFLSADDLGEIMRAMGFRPTEEELKDLLKEIDEDGSGEIEIGEFFIFILSLTFSIIFFFFIFYFF